MTIIERTAAVVYDSEHDTCETCDVEAVHRTCDDCGESGWIVDCGHRAQPRPIAADGSRVVCDACSVRAR